MNEYILKMIVGHEIADITEKVYTHRTVEDLKREMEKITKWLAAGIVLLFFRGKIVSYVLATSVSYLLATC